MSRIVDPTGALTAGLAAIRSEFQVPAAFAAETLAAAAEAARRAPTEHIDRTALPFVTLDPATSTDLDQAFAIQTAGADLILNYAIADVAWFVPDDGPVDREAWARGETLYLPDGKASLYPAAIGEAAASLLPDGPRPAINLIVRIDPQGNATLDGAERAIIRSRAKLAYDSVTPAGLPPEFPELARRIAAAEARRGAARVDPPEQEVAPLPGGGYELVFRPRLASEDNNAALSLAANLAVAQALQAHHTGLFRVMPGPDKAAIARLRHTARALRLDWPTGTPLAQFEQGLTAADPHQAAMMLAIRRAGQGATYAPYADGVTPWHSAMAATYAHATAPLRRLADRYVLRATLEIANGRPVPEAVTQAFARLPKVMARADALAGRVERAVLDLAEAVLLQPRIGETFAAIVTDSGDHGARFQLRDLAVIARLGEDAAPGTALDVRLSAVDLAMRSIRFERT